MGNGPSIYIAPTLPSLTKMPLSFADLEPSGTEFASVVLEHHSNLTPLKQTWKSKVLSENWDAPVVFTTAVQTAGSALWIGNAGSHGACTRWRIRFWFSTKSKPCLSAAYICLTMR